MASSKAVRIAASAASVGVVGGLAYVMLRATGVIEPERAEGDSFILDTFTMPTTKEEFIRVVSEAAFVADPTLEFNARLLLAAWAAHESGWGKTNQAKVANNLFNFAQGSWPVERTIPGNDTEYTPGAVGAKKITQRWRVYESPAAAISDLLAMLRNSRYVNYREAYVLLTSGSVSFASALGVLDLDAQGVTVRVDNRPNTAGYYTLPRSKYQRAMTNLYNEVVNLASASGLRGLPACLPIVR